MASFIAKIFGGGRKKKAPPAPKPQASKKPKNNVDQSVSATQNINRRGRAGARSTQTNFTGPLGVSVGQKRDLQRKYLTGA